MLRPFSLIAVCTLFAAVGLAQESDQTKPDVLHAGGIEFIFATADRGRELLRRRDRFVDHMSPFDRQVRMRTSDDKGIDGYLDFVAGEVLEWPEEKRNAVREAIESLDGPLRELKLPKTDPIALVHTSGREESRAAYTRGSAIVLPPNMIASDAAKNRKLLAHELFHVVSRGNSEWRDELYSVLGFQRVGSISLPKSATGVHITNPDAPTIEHAIEVKLSEEKTVFVTPMVYSERPFDAENPQSMFAYLEFQLMELMPIVGKRMIPNSKEGQPVFHDPSLPDFQRQIGRNTRYIVHPEEILADNFALMVIGAKVRDAWVIDRMRETLSAFVAE